MFEASYLASFALTFDLAFDLAFVQAFVLAFDQAFVLAFGLAFDLAFVLASFQELPYPYPSYFVGPLAQQVLPLQQVLVPLEVPRPRCSHLLAGVGADHPRSVAEVGHVPAKLM